MLSIAAKNKDCEGEVYKLLHSSVDEAICEAFCSTKGGDGIHKTRERESEIKEREREEKQMKRSQVIYARARGKKIAAREPRE